MGLDMYLNKRIYIGANYEHNKIAGAIALTKDGKPIKVDLSKVTYITESVAYWRKANHIHNWFVENVQEGKDDCGEYYVSSDKIKELISLCKETVAIIEACPKTTTVEKDWQGEEYSYEVYDVSDVDDLPLPTQEGFFFGSTEYDSWYIKDCQETIKMLEEALKDKNDCEFYYQSSW